MKSERKTAFCKKLLLSKGRYSPSFHYLYGFYHFAWPSQYFGSLPGSILCRSSHTAGRIPACLRLGRKQLNRTAKRQERQQPPAAMGTTISTDWRLKFQREIIPTAVSQVREGGPNDTGLSFKAKCYCKRAWTWLHHPLKGRNNDSHVPARGNKAKQEFCLHKV